MILSLFISKNYMNNQNFESYLTELQWANKNEHIIIANWKQKGTKGNIIITPLFPLERENFKKDNKKECQLLTNNTL